MEDLATSETTRNETGGVNAAETAAAESARSDSDLGTGSINAAERVRGGRPWLWPAVAALAVSVGLLSYSGYGARIWGGDPAPAAPDDNPAVEVVETIVAETEAERHARWRRTALGRWKTYYKGDRFMTVRADGTATIEANLTEYSWLERSLVGASKVTFEIVWTIEDGALSFDTVGGAPKASVDFITSMHGRQKTYPLVHITDDELRYHSDKPTEADYVWQRLPDSDAG